MVSFNIWNHFSLVYKFGCSKTELNVAGSDEEWVFNELQMILGETPPCTTRPVYVCGLLWMLRIFPSFDLCSSLSYLLSIVFLLPLLLTRFTLVFNTYFPAPRGKAFLASDHPWLLTFERKYVLIHLLHLS